MPGIDHIKLRQELTLGAINFGRSDAQESAARQDLFAGSRPLVHEMGGEIRSDLAKPVTALESNLHRSSQELRATKLALEKAVERLNAHRKRAGTLGVFSAGQIIVNPGGVYVPRSIFGEGEREIHHEVRRQQDGSTLVRLFTVPDSQERPVAADRNPELRWMKEHEDEYAGRWVALDGDRLLSSGPDAQKVYDEALATGVRAPFLAWVEEKKQLPFGGW